MKMARIFEEFDLDSLEKKSLRRLISQYLKESNEKSRNNLEEVRSFFTSLIKNAYATTSKKKLSKEEEYQEIWNKKNVENSFAQSMPETKFIESRKVFCDGKIFFSSDHWLTGVTILCIASRLRQAEITTVIEVGSGNGMLCLALAALFPKINFVGLELTEMGVKMSASAAKNEKAIKNLCLFVFGKDCLKKIKFPLANVEFIKRDISKGCLKENADLVYTSLALEQMDSIFNDALMNIISLGNKEVLMFEPFLEFNSKKGASILKRKGYLHRYFEDHQLPLHFEKKMLSLPRQINKTKFSFGIAHLTKL